MCHKYAKVIIVLLFLFINSSWTYPTEMNKKLPEVASLISGDAPVPNARGRGRVPRIDDAAPSPKGRDPDDTVVAKFGNTTIIFGHQHVLFAAPTRQSNPESENLIAPSIGREERKNELVPEKQVASSEEMDFFEEYSYEVAEDEEKRRELCPDSKHGRQQLLFDTKAKKCAKVGEKAHCGTNMAFRYDPNVDNSTLYGYCECDFSKSRTPLVYHAETNSCYFIYQKAYCDTKQWLIFNKDGVAGCEKRTCPKSSSRRSKLLTEIIEVPINGTGPCVPLNQPSKHCESMEETVHFHANELYPRCGIQRLAPAPRIISPIRSLKCRPGSYVNIVGKCQPAWQW